MEGKSRERDSFSESSLAANGACVAIAISTA